MGVLHPEPHAGFTQLVGQVGLKGQKDSAVVGIAGGGRDQGAGHGQLHRMRGPVFPPGRSW